MAPKIVLITGASRGLGRGLLERYLLKPNHTVIAGNRKPDDATSKSLFDLPKAEGSSLLVVKIDSASSTDAAVAVTKLQSQGIDHLDIVIANAGIGTVWPKVSEAKVEDIRYHMEINVYGMIWLYQATLPLLKKSESPVWMTMGTAVANFTVCVGILPLVRKSSWTTTY